MRFKMNPLYASLMSTSSNRKQLLLSHVIMVPHS
jgi:hypothetical protein